MLLSATTILALAFHAIGCSHVLQHAEDTTGAESYIFDGTEAAAGSLPFMVAIINDKGYEKGIHCGGTILTSTKILTAAHCFNDFDMAGYTFYAGVGYDDLDTGARHPGAQLIKITSFVAPKEFGQNTVGTALVGDIAIAMLDKPIKLSATVKPVVLGGRSKTDLMGKTGFVAGWGFFSHGDLMIANDQTVSPDDEEYCTLFTRGKPLPSSMMCVTNLGQESCSGDSGGPFIIAGKQEGLVSGGPQCTHGFPGYYTNIGSWKAWIEANGN